MTTSRKRGSSAAVPAARAVKTSSDRSRKVAAAEVLSTTATSDYGVLAIDDAAVYGASIQVPTFSKT